MSKKSDIISGEWIESQEQFVSSKLFRARSNLGIEREELAAAMGIEDNDLASYEMGVQPIPVSDLVMAATLMGIDVNYFYVEDDLLDDETVANANTEEIPLLLS